MRVIFERLKRVVLFLFRKPFYAEVHYSDIIISPIRVTPKYICLKEGVSILNNARIEGVNTYLGKSFSPKIILDKGVTIQQNLHLTCANSIIVGENTAVAANVTITDIHHPYDEIDKPIEYQDIVVKSVEIGADCKIYNNTVILPGAKIGKHVTVGANSVVNGIFPDFCVIVGAPARIIKRYDHDLMMWRKTDAKGNFINNDD